MKRLITVLFLIAAYQLQAQKNIDGLTNAEKNFAAWSIAHGTKDAFLKFADSNGIVFDQGNAVNAINVWKKRENGTGILKWGPEFAELSLSRDFGYTNGPWQVLGGINNDSVIAKGRFITLWHIDRHGEWKFLVDIGVRNALPVYRLLVKEIKVGKVKSLSSTNEVMGMEQEFIRFYQMDKVTAYKKFLSRKTILNRNNERPSVNRENQTAMIQATPSNILYTIAGSGMAPGGDLAYVYGNTLINNKQDNYLRIWRKEKGGWKIALEVLRY